VKLFRYTSDIIPVLAILILSFLDLAVYLLSNSIWVLSLWLLISLLPKMCICSWNHHHQHLHTFYNNYLNRVLELFYAFHTGVTTNAWVLHHNLGHHLNYLDQKKDESGWQRKDGSIMGELEYTFMVGITAHWRCYKVGKRHPKYQKGFLTWGSLVGLLTFVLLYFNWLNALFVYLLPMLFGYLVTVWHTYSHHAGLETDNHLEASHNIMHVWYNRLTGNLGFHTAHHMKPGIHWSKLPEYHASIEKEIPKELFVDPPLIFKIFGDREYPLNA